MLQIRHNRLQVLGGLTAPSATFGKQPMPELLAADMPRVLIVDDDTTMLIALSRMLNGRFAVQVARTGQDGLRLARLDPPDLVMLDVEMPGLGGHEVCAQLKQDPSTSDVPVLFLTANADEASELRALDSGGADFLAKPPRAAIVKARVGNLVRMKRLADRLRREAVTDGLTGLANRARLDEVLQVEWLRTLRNSKPLAVMMVDVDHFKAYNDHHGHQAGDDALREVAAALKSVARRPADLVARYGGEEFTFVLPETDLEGACTVAQSVLAAVSMAQVPHGASSVADHLTVSIGLSSLNSAQAGPALRTADSASPPDQSPADAAALLRCADMALYSAKSNGRNQAWYKVLGSQAAVAVGMNTAHKADSKPKGPA